MSQFSFKTLIVQATENFDAHIACYVNDEYVGRLRVVNKNLTFRGPGMVFKRMLKHQSLPFEEIRPLEEIENDPIVRRYLASYSLMNSHIHHFES